MSNLNTLLQYTLGGKQALVACVGGDVGQVAAPLRAHHHHLWNALTSHLEEFNIISFSFKQDQ